MQKSDPNSEKLKEVYEMSHKATGDAIRKQAVLVLWEDGRFRATDPLAGLIETAIRAAVEAEREVMGLRVCDERVRAAAEERKEIIKIVDHETRSAKSIDGTGERIIRRIEARRTYHPDGPR